MDTIEIETLIASTALGDRSAFSQLYDKTAAKLLGICLRVLQDRAVAEDALQDVYIKIWNNADRYQVTGHHPMSWLTTIARNTAIDHLRMRKPETELGSYADVLPAPGLTPEQAAVAASQAGRLARCLQALDDNKRDAVKGAYLNGETYSELAARFAVPLNTMRTWLRRSLINLRECMSNDD